MAYARMSEDEIEKEEHRYRQSLVPRIAEVIVRVVRAQKTDPADVPTFKIVVRYGDPRQRGSITLATKRLGIPPAVH